MRARTQEARTQEARTQEARTQEERTPPLVDQDRATRFEALYGALYERILGYVLRRCDGPEDAADVVAETFAIAWRRIDVLPDGDEARPWLYGVARKVLANHRRGVLRRRELAVAMGVALAHWYEPSAEDSAERGLVARAFRDLPADDRELLSLIVWEGLDHGELAQVLGCSRNAVRIRVHRARRRLSRALEAAGLPADLLATSGRTT